MIPIQLTIKGLYSYQKSTTIDFEPLVQARLFGIFGPVGSGKSAILEAIMFVLFDRSTRLNKAGDDRYYNMMNLQSNEMIIDFIFMAGPNNQFKYRFYFKARRKAKDFTKVEAKDRSYYKWNKNDWQPLANGQVLDMTYENFMQTVIIPQGKFREFVDQKPAARTQMLKELFHLEKYDLAPQANALLNEARDRLTYLNGQLSQYHELTEALITKLQSEADLLIEELKIINKKEKELAVKNLEMEKRQAHYLEFLETGKILDSMNKKQEAHEKREQQLKRYEVANNLFPDKIGQRQGYLKDLTIKRKSLTTLKESMNDQRKKLLQTEEKYVAARTNLDHKENWRIEIQDLDLLIDIKKQKGRFDTLNQRWKEEQAQVEKLRRQEGQVTEQVIISKSHLKDLEGALDEYRLWQSKSHWWEKEMELNTQIQNRQGEWESLQADTQQMLTQRERLLNKGSRIAHTREAIEKLRAKFLEHQLQADWQEHARHLQEGRPCPLCGATHHPRIISAKGLDAALERTASQLEQMQAREAEMKGFLQQGEILEAGIRNKESQAQSVKETLGKLKKQLEAHAKNFPGGKLEPSPKNLPLILETARKRADKWPKLQQELAVLQEQKTHLNKSIAEKLSSFQSISSEKEQLQGAMDQKRKLIKSLDPKKHSGLAITDLQRKAGELRHNRAFAEKEFEQYGKQREIQQQALAKVEILLKSEELQIADLEKRSQTLEKNLHMLCTRESFKGLQEVEKILSLSLNAESERQELSSYRENLRIYSEKYRQLQQTLGAKKYDSSAHQALLKQLTGLTQKIDQQQHQLSGKQHALSEKRQQLEHKTTLLQLQDTMSLRKDQLQEISNLLRGNGFINFISSVYLQNLCKLANARFFHLTSKRLSLELNDQNDFLVRDFLNDGKLRLLKTLSGGQIFQASLCLALALAENVKTINQADHSFFFLDEGFGSLDKSSLEVVFNTLKSLQKENRIVGIISHVEELQEEIDVYLNVQQLGEKGSVISQSWESAR